MRLPPSGRGPRRSGEPAGDGLGRERGQQKRRHGGDETPGAAGDERHQPDVGEEGEQARHARANDGGGEARSRQVV
jgi:hypothetical protein